MTGAVVAKNKQPLKPWQKGPPVVPVVLNEILPRQSFLIICEGKETERSYFESFRATKQVRDFAVLGEGRNTLSLVKRAVDLRSQLKIERDAPFDQAWCVFDRDDFPAQQFNAAITLAEQQGFKVAFSNQAFEIWYLLHFDFHSAAISRQLYKEKLTEKFGYPYEKNSSLPDLFHPSAAGE